MTTADTAEALLIVVLLIGTAFAFRALTRKDDNT